MLVVQHLPGEGETPHRRELHPVGSSSSRLTRCHKDALFKYWSN